MSKRLSKYETITEAVASGDNVETLRAMADHIAATIDSDPSSREVPALHLRLLKTLEAIEEAKPKAPQSAAQSIKARSKK